MSYFQLLGTCYVIALHFTYHFDIQMDDSSVMIWSYAKL